MICRMWPVVHFRGAHKEKEILWLWLELKAHNGSCPLYFSPNGPARMPTQITAYMCKKKQAWGQRNLIEIYIWIIVLSHTVSIQHWQSITVDFTLYNLQGRLSIHIFLRLQPSCSIYSKFSAIKKKGQTVCTNQNLTL